MKRLKEIMARTRAAIAFDLTRGLDWAKMLGVDVNVIEEIMSIHKEGGGSRMAAAVELYYLHKKMEDAAGKLSNAGIDIIESETMACIDKITSEAWKIIWGGSNEAVEIWYDYTICDTGGYNLDPRKEEKREPFIWDEDGSVLADDWWSLYEYLEKTYT
jgi:hypothetical protein